jgi:hypothetical protein
MTVDSSVRISATISLVRLLMYNNGAGIMMIRSNGKRSGKFVEKWYKEIFFLIA